MNLIRGSVTAEAFVADAGDFRLPLQDGDRAGLPAAGKKVILGVRPEALRLGRTGPAATVEEVEPLGNETIVSLKSADLGLTARVDGAAAVQRGETVGIEVAPGALHWFDAGTETRLD